jgi:putative transposase
MPDHFHILLTPKTSLEKTVQFIKGGFSYRAKKELGSSMEVWQKGFSDHRIRDAGDYLRHVDYIRQNPVRKNLCERVEEYPYSSAAAGIEVDPVPQGLKPILLGGLNGAPEGAPFQNSKPDGASEGAPFQNLKPDGAAEAAPFQSKHAQSETSSAAPVQNKSGKIAS